MGVLRAPAYVPDTKGVQVSQKLRERIWKGQAGVLTWKDDDSGWRWPELGKVTPWACLEAPEAGNPSCSRPSNCRPSNLTTLLLDNLKPLPQH